MRFMRLTVALALFLALAGCGSGKPSADVTSIKTLLTQHYAHPECAQLTAQGRAAFGHPVDDAACAIDIAKQAPDSVTVSSVKVNGTMATAQAKDSHGGQFVFSLLKVAGTWVIDGDHG